MPTDKAALRRCESLVRRYADQPMDYADATLIVAAEDLQSDLVFTLDTDFDIYRTSDGRALRRVP